jgi:hypothetical protein
MKIIKNTLMQSLRGGLILGFDTFIADAIYKQLTTLEHVLFGGFTHEPAIEVAEADDGDFAKTNKNILL